LGAIIFERDLPLSNQFQSYVTEYKLDPLKIAIGVGEDYCLLLTISSESFAKLSQQMHAGGFDLFTIGRMNKEKGITLVRKDGAHEPLLLGGWDHFKEKNI
jgi:thiamine monophosphate kinase